MRFLPLVCSFFVALIPQAKASSDLSLCPDTLSPEVSAKQYAEMGWSREDAGLGSEVFSEAAKQGAWIGIQFTPLPGRLSGVKAQRRILGKLKAIAPESDVYTLQAPNGKKVLIDASTFQDAEMFMLPGSRIFTAQELRVLVAGEPQVSLPQEKFDNGEYCRVLKAIRKNEGYDRYRGLARQILDQSDQGSLMAMSLLSCATALTVSAVTRVVGDAHRKDATSAIGAKNDPTWIGQHGSNFTLGMGYMSALQCLMTPLRGRETYLSAVRWIVAANLAGNVWEEVRLPGLPGQKSLPLFRSSGREVGTDWGDFISGGSASLVFLLFHEAVFRTKDAADLEKLCPSDGV
ncbi:MAG: hypothetical protein H7301_03940 [Cryobacterium sp.]|nr:hypothetical protein [Oligoflexia bacterium]